MAERTGEQVNGMVSILGVNNSKNGVKILATPERIRNTDIKTFLDYEEIKRVRNDPTVKLVRRLVIAPSIIAGWSVETEQDIDPKVKKAVEDVFIPLHNHVMRTGLQGNMDFGFTPFEKVWEYNPKTKYRELRKLKHLLQPLTEILVGPHGEYRGLKNYTLDENGIRQEVPLDVEETLLLYQDVEGTNWYGESDLVAVKPICDDYNVIAGAADRYDAKVAGTHWVVYYPANGETMYNGTMTDNYKIAVDILNRIESSGKMAIPVFVNDLIGDLDKLNGVKETGWRIELIEASGAANTQMIARMKYIDTLKVRGFGFPERSILEGQHGTLAEAEAHGDLASLTINTRRIDITMAVNWHCVNHFLRVNFSDELENRVFLVPNPINDISVKFLQSVYQTLISGSQLSAELQRSVDTLELGERLRVPMLTKKELAKLPPLPPDAATLEQQRQKLKPGEKGYVPPPTQE